MEIIIIVLILVDIGARVAPFLMKKREIKEKDEIVSSGEGFKVRIFDLDTGLTEYEHIKVVRMISKEYNLFLNFLKNFQIYQVIIYISFRKYRYLFLILNNLL